MIRRLIEYLKREYRRGKAASDYYREQREQHEREAEEFRIEAIVKRVLEREILLSRTGLARRRPPLGPPPGRVNPAPDRSA